MKQYFKDIPLQDIDDIKKYDIHPFLENAPFNKDLAESIRTAGLLKPPILATKADGRYEIVCGRQRLRCVRSLNETSCYCQLIDNRSPDNILHIILEDQISNGPLTIIEQACFIKICNRLLPESKRRNIFLQSLPEGKITKGAHFLTLLSEIDTSLQYAIHSGTLSEKTLSDILRLPSEDRHIFLDVVQSLKIGGNNQRKLLLQLRDILKRHAISLKAFVKRNEIQGILRNSKLDAGEKTVRLLEQVQELHQPLLSSARASFEREIKGLKLPENASLTPANSFEKNEVTLKIRFRCLDDFKTSWKKIEQHLKN